MGVSYLLTGMEYGWGWGTIWSMDDEQSRVESVYCERWSVVVARQHRVKEKERTEDLISKLSLDLCA